MQALYFAYGSNLCASRLRRRVPSAACVGRAREHGLPADCVAMLEAWPEKPDPAGLT